MKNKLLCCPVPQRQVSKLAAIAVSVFACFLWATPARAADAPPWMHALVSASLPAHDEKTEAVQLHSETDVTVVSVDKIRTRVREAYKILRSEGRHFGTLHVYFDSHKKITYLRAWCIPAQGKDFEASEKDAFDQAPPAVQGNILYQDIKRRVVQIPAPDPQNIIGYEYEIEEEPLVLQDVWEFQEISPARESHYSLQLPAGWEYKASFVNYPNVTEIQTGANQWQWTVTNVEGIRPEEDMPPFAALAGRMVVSLLAPGGAQSKAFSNWQQMGNWYLNLTKDRRDVSPELKAKVASLTATAPTQLEKMKALANFAQDEVRYVAIELGIGGWQPHTASDIFSHRYGDCKDKATLMSTMLRQIGVDSYYVLVNWGRRGAVTSATPAYQNFNHAIVAIKLPDGVNDRSLKATINHPKLGRLLFFDPTNEFVPFGQIGGYLQANYGLLVSPDGGELVELPKEPPVMHGLRRAAKLTLDSQGNLQGDVLEILLGDYAWKQRAELHETEKDTDRIKPFERRLATSLSNFHILRADTANLTQNDKPLAFRYSFQAQSYAKNAGTMLVVRPRVLGVRANDILETKESRQYPVQFEAPALDSDTFEITLPAGYVVDALPPPVDADYDFASYHSKTEAKGNVLTYSRTFEIKELSVPVSRAQDLKKFYRIIASDERNTAILKPAN